MREWILSFSLGVWLAAYIPVLPSREIIPVLLLPFILACRYKRLRLGGAFCLGLFWFLSSSIEHIRSIIPSELEQVDVWLQGYVKGLPQYSTDGTRFTFVVHDVCVSFRECESSTDSGSNINVLLSDFSGLNFTPGEHWQLKAKLKKPHGFSNPGGFDYEAWLFQQKISATGYVRSSINNSPAAEPGQHFLFTRIDRARDAFREKLMGLPALSRSFILALTLGDRFLIQDDEWELLTLTGTNHLMVISGLHISLVAWLVYQASFFLFRQSTYLTQFFPANRLAAFAALFMACLYGLFAGFSLPVQRALVMLGCIMLGHLFVRQTSPLNSLCLALLLVLIIDPFAMIGTGFWLSFLAVTVLLVSITDRSVGIDSEVESGSNVFKRLHSMVRSQLFLFMGLFPVMILFFQQVSLMAPIVNLFAIPFIGLVVVPLCLVSISLGLIFPATLPILIGFPDFLLYLFINVLLQLSERAGFMIIHFPPLPTFLLCILILVVAFMLITRNYFSILATLVLCILLLLHRPERPGKGDLYADILDVGQGLAIVLRTQNHLLVYDTGPAVSERFNTGSGVIEPFLKKTYYETPDVIIISHADNDHAGGARYLAERFPEARVFGGEKVVGIDTLVPCIKGQHWWWDEVHFEMLHPQNPGKTGNNSSCVLKISVGAFSILLPGDIESDAELALVSSFQDALAADILIAPHHGSQTSSVFPLLRHVDPDYAVFSTGYLNRFNHPHPKVEMRYNNNAIHVLNTPDTGHIRFRLSSQYGISEPEKYRDLRPRIWSYTSRRG